MPFILKIALMNSILYHDVKIICVNYFMPKQNINAQQLNYRCLKATL